MGLIEQGETPAEAAAREVREETGWRTGEMKPLIYAQPANGITDSEHFVFRAEAEEYAGRRLSSTNPIVSSGSRWRSCGA